MTAPPPAATVIYSLYSIFTIAGPESRANASTSRKTKRPRTSTISSCEASQPGFCLPNPGGQKRLDFAYEPLARFQNLFGLKAENFLGQWAVLSLEIALVRSA